jgi:hypothetical protein
LDCVYIVETWRCESVVQGVIDVLRRDAEPACRVAIDNHFEAEAVVLLIARHVPQLGQLLHPVHKARNP